MSSKLISICLVCVTAVAATKLQLSTDNGQTWQPFNAQLPSAPPIASIRLSDQPLTVVQLPSCAFKGSLRVQVWRTKRSDESLGLRWQSTVCHPHVSLDDGIVVEHLSVVRHKPEWVEYAHQKKDDIAKVQHDKKGEKGFFGKYGLYIMIFVGIALGQGIRKGLAELREEMEREDREQKLKKPPGQIKLVVPKRKESAKTRKKAVAPSAK